MLCMIVLNGTLCVFRPQELKLNLTEKTSKGKTSDHYMGYIYLICTLTPKTQDEKEQVSEPKLTPGGHTRQPTNEGCIGDVDQNLIFYCQGEINEKQLAAGILPHSEIMLC